MTHPLHSTRPDGPDPTADHWISTRLPRGKFSRQSRALANILSMTLRPAADVLGVGRLGAQSARGLFNVLWHGSSPPGTTITAVPSAPVPTYRIAAPAADSGSAVVLYVHGGGFVFGSLRSYRRLASWLSHHARMPVVLPEYRRAPEHRRPAARDDVLACYRHLLDSGIPANRIAFAGDSAGCHIIGDVLAELARGAGPLPAAGLLFSPLLDLSGITLSTADGIRRDPFASPRYAYRAAKVYLGDTAPEDADFTAGNVKHWPPTLIQIGDTECMLPSVERFVRKLRNAGVSASLQIWPGQVHVFQAFAGWVPEGRIALAEAGTLLAAQFGPRPDPAAS